MKEWGQRGNGRRSLGGGFIGGGDESDKLGSFHPLKYHSGPSAGADTTISQRWGLASSAFEGDYYENLDEEDIDYEEDSNILETIVLKENGQISLLKTLENLNEYRDYANRANAYFRKIKQAAEKRKNIKIEEIDEINEEEIEEFSAIGGGAMTGYTVPIGKNKKIQK